MKITQIIGGLAIFAFIAFLVLITENERKTLQAVQREEECTRLAAIGKRAGDVFIIAGDMPTWKIECLFDGGGK